MATITTTTTPGPMSYPALSSIDRSPTTNELWAFARTTTTVCSFYKSSDSGASWSFQGSFTKTGLYDIGEIRIDKAGDFLHMVYLFNDGTYDNVAYRPVDIRSGGASPFTSEVIITRAPASSPRDYYHSCGVLPYKNQDGTYSAVIGLTYHSGVTCGASFHAARYVAGSTPSLVTNDNLLNGQRAYTVNGNDLLLTVSMDFEHNGDGITTNTPNIWSSFQIGTVAYLTKFSWQGYKTGWSTPSVSTKVDTGRLVGNRDFPGRWDGARFVMASIDPSTSSFLAIYERNQANTSTTKRSTPTHPQGVITEWALSWNHVTKDLRVFAVGTTTAVCYYVDYIRSTATWGSWTSVSATAPLAGEWSVRRGTAGSYQYDFYMGSGGASPYTLSNVILGVNFSPTAPTWIYGASPTPTVNGAAFDVSSSLALDWQFNDPNATDVQSAYALSRQIGSATIQYFRASDNTWQAAEVQNSSATSAKTLTTAQWLGAGGASDAAHVYKVKTWDSGSLPSAYSDGLYLVPSTRVDPTLTGPTASQVFNAGTVTATWTVSEQSAYRVTLTNTATGALTYDSGYLTDPGGATPAVLSYQVPYVLPNAYAGTLTLQTRNVEGLPSVVRSVAFSIAFVEPVAPIVSALTATPSTGTINVTITQAAATSPQPATTDVDIWRRKSLGAVPINVNPTFEVDASDWGNAGFASAARSTAQAHTGVGSLLCTPNGSTALPFALMTAFYPVTEATRWEFRAWFRATTTASAVRLYLRWYDTTSTLISSTTRDMSAVATTWVWAQLTGQAPALATSVRLGIGYVGTPLATDLLYLDDLQLFAANDDTGIRIATAVTLGAAVGDWRAVTGTPYEYRGYATGVNDTAVYGPWVS
jgi:hypothetical protein